ncbi:MAG: hypothetical protein ACE5G9_03925 [Nitrospinales bacterium]
MPENRLIFISENIFRIQPEDRIVGSFLYDKHKEVIAKIEGLVLEREIYLPRFLVITQGGFLDIRGKKILLPRAAYEVADLGEVKTTWSRQSLQDAPTSHDLHNISIAEEERIFSYFDLPPYWTTDREQEGSGNRS